MRSTVSEFGRKILYIIIGCWFLSEFLIGFFDVGSVIRFSVDLFIAIGLVTLILKKWYAGKYTVDVVELLLLIFILFMMLSLISIEVVFFNWIFTFRTYIKGFGVFVIAKNFLKEKDYIIFAKFLFGLLIIHLLTACLQFVSGVDPDAIGGVFGQKFGVSNTFNHSLLLNVSLVYFGLYIYKRINFPLFLSVLVMGVMVATIAEIKVYYIELLIFIFCYGVGTKKITRTVMLGFLFLLIAAIGINFFEKLYPDFSNFYSIEGLTNHFENGYGGTLNAVSRGNGFSFIVENVFNSSAVKTFFGQGFGNVNVEMMEDYHIAYFAYTKVFCDSGIIGIFFYVMFFISIIKNALKNREHFQAGIALVTTVYACFLFFYDSELINVIIYFVLLAGAYNPKNV